MLPNFLIIGAQKSGTTALYWYIRQHPDVFMPERKEPNHFSFARPPAFSGPGAANRAVTDRAEYEALFEPGAGRKALGEASTSYLYTPGTAERIERELPGARLMAILRHPADRAFSAYLQMKRDGREPARDFAEALALEPQRLSDNWAYGWRYRDFGYYGAQLARYYERFPRDRIRVYLHEDLRRDPIGVARDAFAFLGVDPSFTPDTSVEPNIGGIPRTGIVGKIIGFRSPLRPVVRMLPRAVRERLKDFGARRTLERPRIDPELRAQLTRDYADDIRRLQALIGRDLSHWLSGGA